MFLILRKIEFKF